MPSCVVKYCKNNSITQNKHTGVTFHKFPEEFDWKNKWIKIIRSNKKDDSWLPSKFSVVCSVHFEDDDLYSTQCGLRRIVKNAIPKKMLADQIGDDDCIVCDSSSSSSGSQTPISHNADQEYIIVIDENSESSGQDPSSLMTDVENDPSNSMTNVENDPSTSMTDVGGDSCNPLLNVRIIPSVCSPKAELINDSDVESTFDNSLESRLRKQLKRETEKVKSNIKKIKVLRQKIRRLDKRYEILNKKLKELKEKNAVDQDGVLTIEIE